MAVKVIVAVYAVLATKVDGVPFQVTVPVYCAVSLIVVTGVTSNTGAVTPGIAAIVMIVSFGWLNGFSPAIQWQSIIP